jgi:hypothetical protein
LRRLDFLGQPQRSLAVKNEEVGFFSTNSSTRALRVGNEEVGFFRPINTEFQIYREVFHVRKLFEDIFL